MLIGLTVGALVLGLWTSNEAFAQQNQEPEFYYVTISLNGVMHDGFYPALEKDDVFLLEPITLQYLGLLVPDQDLVSYGSRQYLPLSGLRGIEYRFNFGSQNLDITCPSSCFPESRLPRVYKHLTPDKTPFGMFLNYDLIMEKSTNNNFFGSLLELGIFSDLGSGNLTYSARDVNGDTDIMRLNTNWTIDVPHKNVRYVFGDSITQHGGWGRAVRFGGIQFGTDFGLQPGFISFPTPVIAGGAALPSTAEVFVNGIRQASINIEPGAFTIEEPPIITGSGNLRVVINDLLGRETIITQPFYASRSLLRKDLAEYSVEAGFLRNNYGVLNNDYNEAFVAGSYRKGLGESLTAGVHAEVSSKQAGFGPYLDWKLPMGGVLSGAAAISVKESKTGGLLELNYSWQGQNLGINASNEWISDNFTRLGSGLNQNEPKMRTNANVGFDISKMGTLSINYTRVDERFNEDIEFASANYSTQISGIGSLSINLSQSFGVEKNTAVFLIFTARLGERTTGSASMDRNNGKWRTTVQASRNAPSNGGFGLRGEATVSGDDRKRAGVTYDFNKGVVNLDYSEFNDRSSTRLGFKGGVAIIGWDYFFSKPIDNSFALVNVGGFKDVDVLRDNRLVTKTNENGQAFISNLRPYEENKISINPLDLPLTADIAGITLKPVPRRRSGVIVNFPVEQNITAMIYIIDENGAPLLPGTIMQVLGSDEIFTLGFEGAAYIIGLEKSITLGTQTKNGYCRVTLEAQSPSSFPTRLGKVVCEIENKGESR
ncbi:MAG: fimbrial biogenesis outer membrane usher protein [Sphingomonadales bacterium]|nr:fimbrial biogenesis outer membrane usher protein [Sphingomonadales bacterium]